MAFGFQLKTFVSIVGGMLNHVRGVQKDVTDFNVGAVARTMLEAPAVEIEEAYQQTFNGLRAAIPVATYQSFNFERLAAAAANGMIHLVITASAVDVTIPGGTGFSTASSRTTFLSQADATIAAGATTADLVVVAADAGAVGNIPAACAFTAAPTIAGFVSATNAKLFKNGRDLETDEERKQRFGAYIQSLQRSTNAALDYGARTAALFDASGVEIERVRTALVYEPYVTDNTQPIAWTQLYIHNGSGSTSTALRDHCDDVLRGYVDPATGKKIPGYKASGTKLDVIVATEVPTNITGNITPEPGFDGAELIPLAEDALARHLLDVEIGGTSLLKDRVILVSELVGIANIVFTVGTADITSTHSQKLVPGTVTITSS